MKYRILALICCMWGCTAFGQTVPGDSTLTKLMGYAEYANSFGKMVPQEKVYLHFDNTSYYRGDRIWFACYVVSACDNRPNALSRTLYVELLDPGGVVVDRRTLQIEEGRCHGDFSLTQLPFRSGFYEVRAYTKYMLNFDERGIFSRVLPVFDGPREQGDYEDRSMQRYDDNRYEMRRPRMERERKVNLRFYPEGGNLVAGVASRVAFEAADEAGQPLEISDGRVIGRDGAVRTGFSTLYDGRGAFDYMPAEGDEAEITVDGREYRFALPAAEPRGVVLRVDNLSSADSVRFSVRKGPGTPSTVLGAAVICGGRLRNFNILEMTDDSAITFALARSRFVGGVARMVLCDAAGRIVADRLFFSHTGAVADVDVRTDKASYEPYEKVSLTVEGRDASGRPLSAPLSLSVRDGAHDVEGGGSILTDLLLMSEIRGYVRRPWYYFESDDEPHREALDQLLMVQGWSRYDWGVWSGTQPIDLKYAPEQGIEVNGRVIHFSTKKPMSDIQLSVLLRKRGEEDVPDSLRSPVPVGFVDVDSLGRFSFGGNLDGEWSMTFSVTNDRNRRKYSRILIDRAFSPTPRVYTAAEMQVTPLDGAAAAGDTSVRRRALPIADTVLWREPGDTTGDMTERVHRIEEVVVRGEDLSDEARIFRDRSTAVRYYDMPSEMDYLRDEGNLTNDLYEVLSLMDENFLVRRASMSYGRETDTLDRSAAMGIESSLSERAGVTENNVGGEMEMYGEWNVSYRGKDVLFVVNHEPSWKTLLKADLLRLVAIKSIYVNEEASVICDYADRQMSSLDALSKYSCVVFVETYPENEIPTEAGRGIRKTWVDGYDTPAEFYMPDYSVMPEEADYRRTLYWNPSLKPDAEGRTEVSFYNNGSCRTMRIDAQTLSAEGAVGCFER